MPKGQFEHLTPEESAKRADEVRRLAFEGGLSIKEIAQRVGSISESRVGQILDTGNDRKRILYYLEKHGGRADSIRDIAVGLDMGINKAQFLVDTLKKRGAVTADVGKLGGTTGDHRAFTNIQLKKRQHGKVVNVLTRREAEEIAPEAPPFVQERIPDQLLNGKDHGPADEPVLEITPDVVTVYEPATTDILAPHDIPRFPILAGLLDRDAKIAEAARLLESAGLDDLALAALGRQDEFSPLEREYMKYAASVAERETGS